MKVINISNIKVTFVLVIQDIVNEEIIVTEHHWLIQIHQKLLQMLKLFFQIITLEVFLIQFILLFRFEGLWNVSQKLIHFVEDIRFFFRCKRYLMHLSHSFANSTIIAFSINSKIYSYSLYYLRFSNGFAVNGFTLKITTNNSVAKLCVQRGGNPNFL